jgi:hypothetical protein
MTPKVQEQTGPYMILHFEDADLPKDLVVFLPDSAAVEQLNGEAK